MEQGHRDHLSVLKEKAVLFGIIPDSNRQEDPLAELESLADTAGALVVGKLTQKRPSPEPGSYLGKGKLEELKQLAEDLEASVLLCDDDLSPAQVRHIEEFLEKKVLDRTELILDIFALRASTRQAQLQVELAQTEYALPRLKRMWTHLSRMEGGIGMRGPGEKQIETDRRQIQKKITELKRQLTKMEKQKEREVQHRNENHYTLALVGYTNAGKSTLMNHLTTAETLVENRLFSTTSTKTKNFSIGNTSFLLSDTVGFIRKLPHHLVASFQSTLEEARQAQLLIHVVDSSHPELESHMNAVYQVLQELKMAEKPMIVAFNKMDQIYDYALMPFEKYPNHVKISAKKGEGIDSLKTKILEHFRNYREELTFVLDPGYGKILAYLYEKGEISESSPQDDKTFYRVSFDKRDSSWLKRALSETQTPFTILDPSSNTNATATTPEPLPSSS
jgi:GTP-binding protein HflX